MPLVVQLVEAAIFLILASRTIAPFEGSLSASAVEPPVIFFLQILPQLLLSLLRLVRPVVKVAPLAHCPIPLKTERKRVLVN